MPEIGPRRGLRRAATALAAALTVTAATSMPASASAPWTTVKSADASTTDQLSAIAAISATDVWAVGKSSGSAGFSSVIEHWNSASWSLVAHPANSILTGIAGTSATDVWAVGSDFNASTGAATPVIEHFNGSAWSRLAVPAASGNDQFNAVAARSPSDAWAVGTSNFQKTLIEHWDGGTWSIVPSPSPSTAPRGGLNILNAVAVDAAGDAWAVGQESILVNGAGCNQTLAEHWDGAAWSVTPTPQSTTTCDVFDAVTATSPNDGWAVGSAGGAGLTEHWDGTGWNIVANPAGNAATLYGVAELSPTDVWTVGNGYTAGAGQTLSMQWNGTAWSTVPTPQGVTGAALAGLAVVPGTTTLWAAGVVRNQPNNTVNSSTLILRNTSG
jgi:hypothetical protein